MILAADIGGTKSLFGVFAGDVCVVQRRFDNAHHADADAVLAAFLAGLPAATRAAIRHACFALAGPVDAAAHLARLTNLPWTLDAATLARRHGLPVPRLVNDFVATARAAMSAGPDARHCLQTGGPANEPGATNTETCAATSAATSEATTAASNAARLVLGAGTGLGMALVLPEGTGAPARWRIVPSEGGHIAFAPADETQVALWRFLGGATQRVGWEQVLSGAGLEAIHRFFGGDALPAASISAQALAAPAAGTPAAKALQLFVRAYGAYAGDMALLALAGGGVFLAGGIAQKILPALRPDSVFAAAGGFLGAFAGKSDHAPLLARMPVFVLTGADIGLRGAALLAVEKG